MKKIDNQFFKVMIERVSENKKYENKFKRKRIWCKWKEIEHTTNSIYSTWRDKTVRKHLAKILISPLLRIIHNITF